MRLENGILNKDKLRQVDIDLMVKASQGMLSIKEVPCYNNLVIMICK